MDKIFPGTFNFSAVKWGAKNEYEYVDNYRILNSCFRKNGVQKNLDIDKLVKCRLLDNTEMCQWIKKYFELHYSGQEYDPIARRNGQDLHYILGGAKVGAPSGGAKKSAAPYRPPANNASTAVKTGTTKFGGASGAAGGKSKGEFDLLEKQVAELSNNNQILDKEREFYFGKLRLIEEMLQKNGVETHPLADSVLKILYAGEDEEMDVIANGDLIIKAGGQEIIHTMDTESLMAGYDVAQKD